MKVDGPGHSLHKQIASIATQLNANVSTASLPQMSQSVTPVVAPVQEPAQTQEPEKNALFAKIRQLESSLESVPADAECKPIRDAISAQIEQAKARINNSKPLAARLEGCQDALTRSLKRQAEAQSLVELAVNAMEQANAQVTRYQAELAEIQALIAKQADASNGSNCLQKLQAQMQAVVAEMTGSNDLEQGETQQAMQQMSALFSQLSGLATKAQLSARSKAAAVTTMVPSPEQQRLQQLLISNALAPAPTVLPMSVDPTPAGTMGEPSVEVITGGG